MLGMFLQTMGHEVFIEHAPARAIERAWQTAPDVCLLDIGLPGMDGNALVRRLRSLPETARAVMVALRDARRFAVGFEMAILKITD